jgi:ATP:ADP antiporter, AAA family
VSTLASAGSLFVFSVLNEAGYPLAIVVSIWLGVFSLFTVTQFWSFASDLYSEMEGHRLFPTIALGGPLGSVFGARMGGLALSHMGVGSLLYIAAVLLLISGMIFRMADYATSSRGRSRTGSPVVQSSDTGAFDQIVRATAIYS